MAPGDDGMFAVRLGGGKCPTAVATALLALICREPVRNRSNCLHAAAFLAKGVSLHPTPHPPTHSPMPLQDLIVHLPKNTTATFDCLGDPANIISMIHSSGADGCSQPSREQRQ